MGTGNNVSKQNNTVAKDTRPNWDKKQDLGNLMRATQSIGGFKGLLNNVRKTILFILEENDHLRVKELLPFQRTHESAHNKCASAISDFCRALDDGSPRLLEYSAQLKTMQLDYFELRDRIDQFLVDMVKVASSVKFKKKTFVKKGQVPIIAPLLVID